MAEMPTCCVGRSWSDPVACWSPVSPVTLRFVSYVRFYFLFTLYWSHCGFRLHVRNEFCWGKEGFRFHRVTAAIQSLNCLNIQHKHSFAPSLIHHFQTYACTAPFWHLQSAIIFSKLFLIKEKSSLILTMGNGACMKTTEKIEYIKQVDLLNENSWMTHFFYCDRTHLIILCHGSFSFSVPFAATVIITIPSVSDT